MSKQEVEVFDFDNQDDCSQEEEEENYNNFDDYYSTSEYDFDCALYNKEKETDPEYFEYSCLSIDQAKDHINKLVDEVCSNTDLTPAIGKVILFLNQWNTKEVIESYNKDKKKLFKLANLDVNLLNLNNNNPNLGNNNSTKIVNSKSASLNTINKTDTSYQVVSNDNKIKKLTSITCSICFENCLIEKCLSLHCGHLFCSECWKSHLIISIQSGLSVTIQCMEQNCFTRITEDFVDDVLKNHYIKKKFDEYSFKEYILSNPLLRHCPGRDCSAIFQAKKNLAFKVQCKFCLSSMCFKCKLAYHAPTECQTIKKWLTKCADDSETANYISVNTKECPKCHIHIEKNEGCNHMHCTGCEHDFCWICLNDWVTHGTEYYECSRFKVNPKPKDSDDAQAKASEALKKYLFYYERWENHARSLRLEEQTLEKIKARVQERVMQSSSTGSTWIDWQYLLDAAALLTKCRYTLQYTYPYVYYMASGPRKQLFEYQQAQLEAEIEALSWKVERAETYDRGEMENQMDIAEKRRSTLLKDFLPE